MVSGSKGAHYWDRGRRIRSGRAHHRAGGDTIDSECRCVAYIRVARHRLSHRDNNFRRVHAESARWLEARGLVANSKSDFATRRTRLRAERSAQDLAMVRALAPAVSQHLRRYFSDLAGSVDLPGIDWSYRNHRCGHGWTG